MCKQSFAELCCQTRGFVVLSFISGKGVKNEDEIYILDKGLYYKYFEMAFLKKSKELMK